MKSENYTYDGKEFPSIKALAKYAGIHEKTLYARIRKGMQIEEACKNKDLRCSYQCDPEDNKEKSIAQICKDKSKNPELVRNRLKYGYSINDALNKPKKIARQGSPIVVNGILYNCISAAIRKHNLVEKESTIRRRLKSGMTPDMAFKFDV